jgi:hypothetical protein
MGPPTKWTRQRPAQPRLAGWEVTLKYAKLLSVLRTYSTKQVATLVGVHWVTLHRWVAAGKVRPSQRIPLNGAVLSRWTDADVKRVQKYKIANYCKGRGRKKKVKLPISRVRR